MCVQVDMDHIPTVQVQTKTAMLIPREGRILEHFAHTLNFHPVGCPAARKAKKCGTCDEFRRARASDGSGAWYCYA